MFYLVIILLAAGDLFFWWWADRRLRQLRSPRTWRILLGTLMALQFLTLCWWVIFPASMRSLGGGFWKPVSAWLYMWHLLVLPLTLATLLLGYLILGIGRLGLKLFTTEDPTPHAGPFAQSNDPDPTAKEPLDPVTGPVTLYPTRRQILTAAATFAPQAVLGGTLLVSASQIGRFRIRNVTLPFPNLPPRLHGMTIAHVSDTHAGRFVGVRELRHIVSATADLKPDLIAFTGDLIDFNLADLPVALSALKDLTSVAPVATCVGNHDLFEDGDAFRKKLLLADVGLLCDEVMPLTIRGEKLNLLGLDWGAPKQPRVDNLQAHMDRLLSKPRSTHFPILLAHHPHAFDPAAQADIPLTLSGHTHGGQIMLTPTLGAGRVYKYWSGLYEKPTSKLFVSNGVGNWFPLRINAPAEIVHLTLTRA
jgi:predicted MPP superfamily phosphohydrolase